MLLEEDSRAVASPIVSRMLLSLGDSGGLTNGQGMYSVGRDSWAAPPTFNKTTFVITMRSSKFDVHDAMFYFTLNCIYEVICSHQQIWKKPDMYNTLQKEGKVRDRSHVEMG